MSGDVDVSTANNQLVENIKRQMDEVRAEVQSQNAFEKQSADERISAHASFVKEADNEAFAVAVMEGRAETPASLNSKAEFNHKQAMSALGKKEQLAMQGIGEAKAMAAKPPVSWNNTPTPPAPVSAPSRGKSL